MVPSTAGNSIDSPTIPPPWSREPSLLRTGQLSRSSASRRASTASSIFSIGGGSLDTSSGWVPTVVETGQNAISSLLQPPIFRTGQHAHASAPASSSHKPPTTKDIPPVTLTNIPIVDSREFRAYLTQTGALHDQLSRIKDDDLESHLSQTRRPGKVDGAPDAKDGSLLRPWPSSRRKGSSGSIAWMSSIDSSNAIKRPSSSLRRKSEAGPPPLSTIPMVYFEDGFHLENPRTFDIVSEYSEVVRPTHSASADESELVNGVTAAPRKALVTNAILQEKLSWYMDTIEMHLITSISMASTTFFSALGALRELHSETAESVERIRSLRKGLEALDREIVTTGLDAVQTRQRQNNIRQLNETVLQLKQIVDGVVTCERSVDEGDVESGLDQLDSLERLMTGEGGGSPGSTTIAQAREPLRPRNLKSVTALQSVGGDMDTLRFRIGKVFESRFQAQLLGDLRRHVDQLVVAEVLMRWTSHADRARGLHVRLPSTIPTYMSLTDELKSVMAPNLRGLHRARHIATASAAYREAVMRELRKWIKRPLPSSSDDDNDSVISGSTISGGRHVSAQEKSTILAQNIRALSPNEAEEMLATIYVKLTEMLRRLATQVKVLLDISSLASSPALTHHKSFPARSPPPRSPLESPGLGPDRQWKPPRFGLEMQEALHTSLDLGNFLGQAVDAAQDKIVKILRVRSEQTKDLSLVWFLRYYRLNLLFVTECEAISGRGGLTLKSLVTGHIKDFVQNHSDRLNRKLAQGMEVDQWTAVDFFPSAQALVDDIVASSTSDSVLWTEGTNLWLRHRSDDDDGESQAAWSNKQPNGDKRDKARAAQVESETFLLPHSAVMSLHGIVNFLRLMAGIPLLTADIATTLISFLQLFNSRATQLILGAGAKRSAGLNTITTKHMALASQALAFVATLIPHVREFVRRRLGTRGGPGPSAALMGDFDKIRRLLQEHQDSIYQKIVEMMRGRAAAVVKELHAVDWDAEGAAAAVATPPTAHPFLDPLAKDTNVLYRTLSKHLPDPAVQMIILPVFAAYKEQLGRALHEAQLKTEAGRHCMIRDIEYVASKMDKIQGFADTAEYLLKIIRGKEVKAIAPAAATDAGPEAASVANGPSSSTEEATTTRDGTDGKIGG